MKLAPRIYTIQNGQLRPKDQSFDPSTQPDNHRIIKYTHTVRASPDDYHTDLIKQYKEENQKLRKNYKDLQKAYWGLLGYCQDKLEIGGSQATPIHQLYKDGTCPNTTENGESTSKYSQANISEFQIDEVMMKTEESRKGPNRLSQSILEQEQIEEFRRNIINEEAGSSTHTGRSRNAKTEVDQDIQDLLIQAFKEVQELKQLLESVKTNSSAQIEQLKADYEAKIQNLESLLDKERRQSRMLNGVINRMREQLQSKQNFFRAVKQVKNGPEKNLIDKLMKQHRLSH